MCGEIYTVKDNRLPPAIMRVCRESYNVTRRYGSLDTSRAKPTWLQPRIDQMLFFHGQIKPWLHYSPDDTRYAKDTSRAEELAAVFDWAQRLGLPLAIYHLDIYPFNSEHNSSMFEFWPMVIGPQVSFLNEFVRRGRGQSFPCPIMIFALHATREQAASSGLFGRLGDEPSQFVDVEDMDRLQQYHRFWQQISPNVFAIKCRFPSEWDLIFARDKLRALIDDWIARVRHMLLAAVWYTTLQNNPELESSLTGVFGNLSLDFPSFEYHPVAEAHPWVLETAPSLPTLLPRINFRVCHSGWCTSYRRKAGKTHHRAKRPRLEIPRKWRVQKKRYLKQRRRRHLTAMRPYFHRTNKTPASLVKSRQAMKEAAHLNVKCPPDREYFPFS